VHDAAGRVGLAELHATEDGGHEVEAEQPDKAPVEPAHAGEDERDSVQLLHWMNLLLSRVRIDFRDVEGLCQESVQLSSSGGKVSP
jgi:hypothetical protein